MLDARTRRTLVLAVSLALGVPAAAAPHAPASHVRPAPRPPVRLLVLGDGYTAGAGIAPAARWPERLAARLRSRGVRVDSVSVIAGGGWSTADVVHALDDTPPAGEFALVLVQAGASDHYRGEPLDDARARFAVLLSRALDLAGHDPHRVVVLSLPDWTRTPFGRSHARGPATDLDAWNAALRERTRLVGAHWVDVTAVALARADDPAAFAPDSLHPSPSALLEWAGAVDDSLAADPPPFARPAPARR